MIQGQLVERIVVHGSERTLWELPTGGGAGLCIAAPLEQPGIMESITIDFDYVHDMEPYGTKGMVNDTVRILMNDTMKTFGEIAGMSDTVQIFINDEEAV